LGELLAPAVKIPGLEFRLAFLAGADGLGFVCLAYWRAVGGPKAKAVLAPLAVFLMFMLLGMKCGHGFGASWLFVCGIANGAFGLAVTLRLLCRTGPPTSNAR